MTSANFGAYNYGVQTGQNFGTQNSYFQVAGLPETSPDSWTTLEIAKEAAFNASGRHHDPLCLADTRVDLLQDIRSWLKSDSTKYIYWLSGWAGTGKSTIARTIAQEYTNSQWQVEYCWPAYRIALQKAVAADAGIFRKTQKAQWASLIQKPLSGLLASSSPPHVLLVIDAVDECGSDADMNYIVELLLDAQEINQTAFRIFVTSRPEVAIRSGFDRDSDQHHFNLVLHQISEFIVQHDLFIFLRFHLASIAHSRGLGAYWPGEDTIRRLVVMSDNLFIWAATVCRFVANGRTQARNRLSSVLEGRYDFGGPDMALDRIYLMVLESAIGDNLSTKEKRDASYSLRYMLGTVAVLFAPLSIIDLGYLLDVETEKFKETLADLHSIVEVPDDTASPIRLHHPSFRDFLCDPGRCRNEALCVDRSVMHSILATRNFKTMFRLQKNTCYLKGHGTILEDVEPKVIQRHIPGVLQYSCRYWLDHSEQWLASLHDDGPVHGFLQNHFPFWLEAMSLVGKVPEAITMMMKLEGLIDEKKALALQSLVRDILRFTQTFSHVLRKAPLQLYSAGFFFSPIRSIARRLLKQQTPRNIKVVTQIRDEWNACIHTLEGHSLRVTSVVFSADGSRVASGSHDNTVRVWDVQTGQCQHTLEGHSLGVTSVVFSADGSRVASGSWDNTVRVWDVQTGQCQHTLEGHSLRVTSVVFSADGSRVASGSDDNTVRVWDVQTGQCQHTLEGHSLRVTSVVFSADGSRVASGSWDNTVRVWDVQTGQCQHTLEGHSQSVTSVVFSADGSRVASGSHDNTVRVWDVQTGQCQHTLEGHSQSVTSVVFSADGSRVASGSHDNTVRVWDVQTGQCQHTLEGHSQGVTSVVFSADGSRVALGSHDNTVRVWDVQTGQCQHTLEGHSLGVTSVVFSADGSRVASGSRDNTVRVWDVQTGQCQHTLEGHSLRVTSVVFSADGSRVASGSWDNTVRVWDVQTGQCQHTLKGHSLRVTSVVFSADGSRVASGSDDNTVRVWDVQTGQCQHTLEGHSLGVTSVVFSADGSRVASGSDDNTVRVWDVQTGQCQHTLEGHSLGVTSVVFSADGSRVASGSRDNTVRVWDVVSSTEILCYDTGAYKHNINFSEDSSQVLVNGSLLSLPPQTPFSSASASTSNTSLNLSESWLALKDDWILLSSERTLWLPPEYRPGNWASYSDTIVVGSGTGRVTFVRCIATDSVS